MQPMTPPRDVTSMNPTGVVTRATASWSAAVVGRGWIPCLGRTRFESARGLAPSKTLRAAKHFDVATEQVLFERRRFLRDLHEVLPLHARKSFVELRLRVHPHRVREAVERVRVTVGVVDDDAGDAVAVGEEAGVQPRGDHQIVARINLEQVLVEGREQDGD